MEEPAKEDIYLINQVRLSGIVHVDLSKKFWEKGNTGIAAINSDKSFHRGLAIARGVKESLSQNSQRTKYTDARLYASSIWKVIKDDLSSIDILIICNDAPFKEVKRYLKYFCKNQCPEIYSIFEFREKLNKNIKSLADNIAKAYRKRGLKPWKRGGVKLNTIRISYAEFLIHLNELDKLDQENKSAGEE